MLISMPISSEEINANGKKYTVEINHKTIQCGHFSITNSERSLPFSIRESRIPYKITMGHHGRPHLISTTLFYKSLQTEKKLPPLESLLVGYNRISSKKTYISTPVKCIGENTVFFRMWGGGNCSNVCEAWASVEFSTTGDIVSIKGLSGNQVVRLQ